MGIIHCLPGRVKHPKDRIRLAVRPRKRTELPSAGRSAVVSILLDCRHRCTGHIYRQVQRSIGRSPEGGVTMDVNTQELEAAAAVLQQQFGNRLEGSLDSTQAQMRRALEQSLGVDEV